MNPGRQPPAAESGRDWREQLTAIPRRNVAARLEDDTPGRVVLAVQTRKPWYLDCPPLSWMVPVRAERRTVLDRLGSEVWRLCDGRRTVEQVVDEFAATHQLSFHEARVAVGTYIRSLVQRGVMAIELPPNQA